MMGLAYGEKISRNLDGLMLDEAERAWRGRVSAQGGIDLLWRVEAVRYAASVLDVTGEPEFYLTAPGLELFGFQVRRWTPTGARLWTGKHVDLRGEAKQYASRTPAEAVRQLAERRRRQIYVLERKLNRAREELALVDDPCPVPLP